jgi:hypothetical protein
MTYHANYVGAVDNPRHRSLSLSSAVKLCNVTKDKPLLVLKVDIEGSEYPSLVELFRYNAENAEKDFDPNLYMIAAEFHQKKSGRNHD